MLRRLIRRAVRFGRKLGLTEPFLKEVADVVIQRMGGAYPDLVQNRAFILRILEGEEQQFGRVLEQGLAIMEESLSATNGHGGVFSGALAFALYDTYGFPVEETQDIARERGLTVDMDAFQREMAAQRERGRAATEARLGGGGEAKIFKYRDLGVGRVTFVGYDRLTQQTEVLALLTPDGDALSSAEAGQDVEVVLRETPFYAEGGGQVGDTGAILSLRGHVDVSDTQSPMDGLIVHRARVRSGAIAPGDQVEARVDRERRMDVARNHSSTHLLHEALRRVLGSHVRQAGSLVAPDRLRFDFTHVQAMTPDEVREVENVVNDQVRRNAASVQNELTYTKALEAGYLAFFGDKYGETVRVIDMGLADPDAASVEPFSREVCGGTHLDRPGEIGLFLITSERSIGSGIRRIEALTGRRAAERARNSEDFLGSVSKRLSNIHVEMSSAIEELSTDFQNQLSRFDAVVTERDAVLRLNDNLNRVIARMEAGNLVSEARDVAGVSVVSAMVAAPSADVLRDMAVHLRDRLGSGVVMLGAVANEKPMLVSMVTPDLVEKGLNAATLVREVAAAVGGGGGGKPDMAQAGGSKPEKLEEALALTPDLVGRVLG